MILETIIGGGILYYAAKNFVNIDVRLKPHTIAQAVEKAKQSVTSATEQVKKQMVSESEWQETKARQKAQAVYDSTVAEIFNEASDEEKETLLALFRKYMHSDE